MVPRVAYTVAISLLFAACVAEHGSSRLTSDQVVHIADAEVRRRLPEYNLEEYRRHTPSFAQKEQVWYVSYYPLRGHTPYSEISARVDDRTRAVSIWMP
jgi:hypothetical protein